MNERRDGGLIAAVGVTAVALVAAWPHLVVYAERAVIVVLAILAMAAGVVVFVAIVWGVWRVHRTLGLHRLMSGGFGCVLQAFFAAVVVTVAAFYARTAAIDVAGGLAGAGHAGGVVLLALGLVAVLALLVTFLVLRTRGPQHLPTRLPLELTTAARIRRGERLFFGWCFGLAGEDRAGMGRPEDSMIVFGPPGSGKTLGVAVTQAVMWEGPVVLTSTKPDVYRWTAADRNRVARKHGGAVSVFAPTSLDPIEGPIGPIRPIRWSPLDGCRDPRILTARVSALVGATEAGKGVENPDHWRQNAQRILTVLFHAAAWHPQRPYDLGLVMAWLSRQADCQHEIAMILENAGEGDESVRRQARASLDMLDRIIKTPERERGSIFNAAGTVMSWAETAEVMQSCSSTELDMERALLTSSTTYVLSPSEQQATVAPLMACFIDAWVQTAYRLDAEGRLPLRLALILDEVCNIAPLHTLPSIVAQARGQGVTLCLLVQNDGQLRDRWGDHGAQALLSSIPIKVYFGGLADQLSLERASSILGQREVKVRTVSGRGGSRTISTTMQRVPVLTPGEIRQIREGWALLIYRHHRPYAVRVPIAFKVPRLRPYVTSWRPSHQPPTPPTPMA